MKISNYVFFFDGGGGGGGGLANLVPSVSFLSAPVMAENFGGRREGNSCTNFVQTFFKRRTIGQPQHKLIPMQVCESYSFLPEFARRISNGGDTHSFMRCQLNIKHQSDMANLANDKNVTHAAFLPTSYRMMSYERDSGVFPIWHTLHNATVYTRTNCDSVLVDDVWNVSMTS